MPSKELRSTATGKAVQRASGLSQSGKQRQPLMHLRESATIPPDDLQQLLDVFNCLAVEYLIIENVLHIKTIREAHGPPEPRYCRLM